MRLFVVTMLRLSVAAAVVGAVILSFACCALLSQWIVAPPPGPSGMSVLLAFGFWVPVLAALFTMAVTAWKAVARRPWGPRTLHLVAPYLD